jgi:membrane fusion protein (multidrug efflux system)
MRTALVYLIALGAVATAFLLGFPELFAGTSKKVNGSGGGRSAPSVILARVAKAPFEDTLEALGTVKANEAVSITPNRADHVAVIHFEDGQNVKKGDLLVEMHAKEETAQLTEAVAVRDDRRLNFKRAKDLFDRDLTSEREHDAAKALLDAAEARVLSLEAAIADRRIVAPFSGVLGLRRVSVGAYVQPSTVITTLDDLSIVKLDFTIPEPWLPNVKTGMTITARSIAWPGQLFPGEVATIDTRLDSRTRSITFRARMPNPDRKLRPGMLLKVTINRGARSVLQVPEEALILSGRRHFVFRVDSEDTARRVNVSIGRRRVGTVEIVSGLAPADLVVVEGIVPVDEGLVKPDQGLKVRVVKIR